MVTLGDRIGAVCEVISSIFTEGHASATDTALRRGDSAGGTDRTRVRGVRTCPIRHR